MSRRGLFLLGIVAGVLGLTWFVASHEQRTQPIEAASAPDASRAAAPRSSASSDRPKASISGTARFQNTGVPAEEVLLVVYCEKSDQQLQAMTNGKGEFFLSGVDADTDLLWRAKEGENWLCVITEDTRLSPGEDRTGVEILLQRVPKMPVISGIAGTVWNASNVNKRMLQLAPKLVEAERNQNETYFSEFQKDLERARTPLPSVTITLEGASLRRETVTDATGRYEFTDLPEGQYTIRATPPKGAAIERASHNVNDKDLGPGELRVELRPGKIKNNVDFQYRFDTAAFAGHVRDMAGNPIAGAEIAATIVEEQAETGPINKQISIESTSASDGSYRVEGLIPLTLPVLGAPRYEVTARAEGHVSQHVRMLAFDEKILLGLIELFEQIGEEAEGAPGMYLASLLPRLKGNTLIDVDFTLPKSTIISGELVDPQSNPIVGSALSLSPIQRQEPPPDSPVTTEPVNVTSGPKGDFSFVDVPPGTYDIRAEIVGAVVRTKHPPLLIRGGEEIRGLRVVAEVQTPGTIEGHVTTADSRRLDGDYSVHVESIANPLETRPRMGRFLRNPTDPQTFYLDDISPGTITLFVTAPGYAQAKVKTELAPGATAKVEVAVVREGVLRVFVTRNGEPVEEGGVSVVQVTDGIARGQQFDASYQTDKDVSYHKITALAEGQYDVMATYSDGAVYRKQRTRISIRANAVTEVTIDLIGGSAGIRGTLFGEDKPGEGEVLVLDAAEAANEVYPFDRSTRAVYWMSKPPRVFEINGLPAGTYRAIGRLGPRGERNSWEERELTVTVHDGEIKEITFEE